MDAITLLRNDHKTVEQLFKRFEKAGDEAYTEKRAIVDRIVEELSRHAAIEEQLFYPVARATVRGVEDIALESLEEHHIVKWTLSELDKLDPQNERFDAKVTVLIESVRHHVKEEQDEFFPKVRDELGRKSLIDLGEALEEAKKTAPTHPHPRSPDEPPGNSITGTVAGAIDKIGDNISGIAQGSVSATQDLVARILGTRKPRTQPTGSSTTRKRAAAVRKTASSLTDGVEDTARSVGEGVTATAKSARSGAKATTTTARKATKSTASAAKGAATSTGRTASKSASKVGSTAKKAAKKTSASARGKR
jgi:hemerythrin superfamily protein